MHSPEGTAATVIEGQRAEAIGQEMRGNPVTLPEVRFRQVSVQLLEEFVALPGVRASSGAAGRPFAAGETLFSGVARAPELAALGRACRRLMFCDSSLPPPISVSLPTPLSKQRTPDADAAGLAVRRRCRLRSSRPIEHPGRGPGYMVFGTRHKKSLLPIDGFGRPGKLCVSVSERRLPASHSKRTFVRAR